MLKVTGRLDNLRNMHHRKKVMETKVVGFFPGNPVVALDLTLILITGLPGKNSTTFVLVIFFCDAYFSSYLAIPELLTHPVYSNITLQISKEIIN